MLWALACCFLPVMFLNLYLGGGNVCSDFSVWRKLGYLREEKLHFFLGGMWMHGEQINSQANVWENKLKSMWSNFQHGWLWCEVCQPCNRRLNPVWFSSACSTSQRDAVRKKPVANWVLQPALLLAELCQTDRWRKLSFFLFFCCFLSFPDESEASADMAVVTNH